MATATVQAPSTFEPEQCLVLSGVAWNQYEAISGALEEQAGLRVIYVDGRITLLSPSYRHDWIAEGLYDLVIAVANGFSIEWDRSGHTTNRAPEGGGAV